MLTQRLWNRLPLWNLMHTILCWGDALPMARRHKLERFMALGRSKKRLVRNSFLTRMVLPGRPATHRSRRTINEMDNRIRTLMTLDE